jgi:hypothetical protein
MLGTIEISNSRVLWEQNVKIGTYKIVIYSVVLVSYIEEGHGLRVFEKKMLMKIFVSRWEEVSGVWR